MHARHRWVLLAAVFALAAGCTAEGATASNFTLTPDRIGWYAGDEAVFVLTLEPSLTRNTPSFVIDRQFAVEELVFKEQQLRFGGDYKTRNPDSVSLRLVRDGVEAREFTLDESNPTVEVHVKLPDSLRDSSYVLEMKLFKVGWVKSSEFRVDRA